jgi:hypothetical protein
LQVTTLDKKVIEEIQIDVLGLFGRWLNKWPT